MMMVERESVNEAWYGEVEQQPILREKVVEDKSGKLC